MTGLALLSLASSASSALATGCPSMCSTSPSTRTGQPLLAGLADDRPRSTTLGADRPRAAAHRGAGRQGSLGRTSSRRPQP